MPSTNARTIPTARPRSTPRFAICRRDRLLRRRRRQLDRLENEYNSLPDHPGEPGRPTCGSCLRPNTGADSTSRSPSRCDIAAGRRRRARAVQRGRRRGDRSRRPAGDHSRCTASRPSTPTSSPSHNPKTSSTYFNSLDPQLRALTPRQPSRLAHPGNPGSTFKVDHDRGDLRSRCLDRDPGLPGARPSLKIPGTELKLHNFGGGGLRRRARPDPRRSPVTPRTPRSAWSSAPLALRGGDARSASTRTAADRPPAPTRSPPRASPPVENARTAASACPPE